MSIISYVITRKQREIFDFICDYMHRRGHRPSYQQIARYFGFRSKATVAKHIAALEKIGLLSRSRKNGTFTLEVVSNPDIALHSLQQIKCSFDNNYSNSQQELFISDWIFDAPMDECFVYPMPDDSMIGEHILAGDLILIEKSHLPPPEGSIVLVSFNDHRLLRKIFFTEKNIKLVPANKNFQSIVTYDEEISLEGYMRALIRPRLNN